MDYYVYYRVAGSDADTLAMLGAFQRQLLANTGIRGRLRRGASDVSIWMEVYEDVADQAVFEATLARLVNDYQVEKCLAAGSARHMERFVCPTEERDLCA